MLQKAKGNNKELFLRVTENVLKRRQRQQEGCSRIMSRSAPNKEAEGGTWHAKHTARAKAERI